MDRNEALRKARNLLTLNGKPHRGEVVTQLAHRLRMEHNLNQTAFGGSHPCSLAGPIGSRDARTVNRLSVKRDRDYKRISREIVWLSKYNGHRISWED